MTGMIYIATNQENLKSYIGQTTQSFEARKRAHLYKRADSCFHDALRKYPDEVWEWRVLEDDIPLHRLSDREVLWIAFYDTFHNGYNMTEGGGGAASQRELAKQGKHPSQTPSFREKIRAYQLARAARGEHHSSDPAVRCRIALTEKRTRAKQRLEGWQEAGQQFLLEMELDRVQGDIKC